MPKMRQRPPYGAHATAGACFAENKPAPGDGHTPGLVGIGTPDRGRLRTTCPHICPRGTVDHLVGDLNRYRVDAGPHVRKSSIVITNGPAEPVRLSSCGHARPRLIVRDRSRSGSSGGATGTPGILRT